MKTKPTHTPGPWTVETNDTTRCGLLVVDSQNVYVARMEGDHGISVDESLARAEANARLIAAAPDLLEAAKLALNSYIEAMASEYDFPSSRWIDREGDTDPAVVLLRAAIAKAEGR